MLERLGRDSINPVRDLLVFMLSPANHLGYSSNNVPLTFTSIIAGSGGFVRTYEAARNLPHLRAVNLKYGNI
jgi:hypothetical protein